MLLDKLSVENKMEPKILEEITKQSKQEVIEFDWEPVRKQPRRYGILYPVIGYIVSLIAVSLMKIGAFMWLFLIGGFLLFLGGIYCANGIIGEYGKISRLSESPKHLLKIEHPS